MKSALTSRFREVSAYFRFFHALHWECHFHWRGFILRRNRYFILRHLSLLTPRPFNFAVFNAREAAGLQQATSYRSDPAPPPAEFPRKKQLMRLYLIVLIK